MLLLAVKASKAGKHSAFQMGYGRRSMKTAAVSPCAMAALGTELDASHSVHGGGDGNGVWRTQLLGPGDVFGEISFFTESPAREVE